ncbi:SWIM zinc finger family protein [Streptomyces sp. NPDC006739]|uniref:SWIM zinc finger family protein n=1 Tax=Streptomyces sp. NPDC006739 TaxID=3364763 RepID=UPI0036CF36E7
MTAGEERPGDAARRALREARGRASGAGAEPAGEGPEHGAEPPAEPPPTDGPRPGDAARAALRSTASARRSENGGDAPATGDPGRPGDVAREALRAARRGTRRTDAPGPDAPPPSRSSGGDEARAARVRAARDMRQFLADAFRMPPTPTKDPDPQPERPTSNPHGATQPDHPAKGADAGTGAGSEAGATVEAGAGAGAGTGTEARTRAGREAGTGSGTETGTGAGTETETRSWTRTETGTRDGTTTETGAGTRTEVGGGTRTEVGSAGPLVPVTMASPQRDSDLRRTFAAFPGRAFGEGPAFAESWWGNAWVGALEQGALDVKRLARGRGYAEQGNVDAITVTPGLVLAYVRGSRPRAYRVQVRLRTLEDADWERFLDAAADRPGHIAALLDKELPQSLADCGVPLLPGPGDLAPRCSCPDSGHPCKHAAALCYQTARLLDADPFVLLLLRGRGERELLDALSRRSAARAARAARERQSEALPGVRAAEALAPRRLPPLPPPLPMPPHPEQPPVYPAAPGGPDPFALDQLATDAAARAHALLATGRDPVGELTLWQDAVRLAAARPGSGLTAATRALYATLAAATGRTPADLARAVAAWRQGGLAGLSVLEEPWDPPAGRFDRARPLLLAADLPAFRPWRNHLTHPLGHIQLRLGRDGLWYAYESEPGRDDWWPRGTPDLDPVGALTELGTPDESP